MRWATSCPGAYTPNTPQAWPIEASFTASSTPSFSHTPVVNPDPARHLPHNRRPRTSRVDPHTYVRRDSSRWSLRRTGGRRRRGRRGGRRARRGWRRRGSTAKRPCGDEAVAAGGAEALGGDAGGAGPVDQGVGRAPGRRRRRPATPTRRTTRARARARCASATSKPHAPAIAISASATASPPSDTSCTPLHLTRDDELAHEVVQRGRDVEVGGGWQPAAEVVRRSPTRNRRARPRCGRAARWRRRRAARARAGPT